MNAISRAAMPTTSDDLLMGNGVVAVRCPTILAEAKRRRNKTPVCMPC